jgi:hypothetical protein
MISISTIRTNLKSVISNLVTGSTVSVVYDYFEPNVSGFPAIVFDITNNNDELMQIFVDVGVYDSTGTQVDRELVIETVPAGRTAASTAWTNNAYVVGGNCEIIDITAYPK